MNAPPNEARLLVVGTEQALERSEQSQHFATDDARRKAEATLIAQFALAGFELRRLDGGGWLVSRWNLMRELDQAALAQFAQRIGAQP